jgi:hypothetical protein
MKPQNITAAIKEAQRFVTLAKIAIAEHKESGNYMMWGTKATGALRRSSMDLTRSLSEMRKP